jgi:3-methylcrotonyl-CoA carboxylase alpha subunit
LNQANVWHDTLIWDGDCIDYSIEVREQSMGSNYLITMAGQSFEASGVLAGSTLTATINGYRKAITIASHEGFFTAFDGASPIAFSSQADDLGVAEEQQGAGDFRAPMNGTIVEVKVRQGDQVDAGAVLLVMEAMKMQHTIKAPSNGTVSALFCEQGDLVDGGSELLTFDATPE